MGQVAIYCRVSTDDQCCDRQERDLRAFAKRAGHKIIGVFKETASGAKAERAERKKVMALAQARKIDAILVTELSRWGRSTPDLVQTLDDLHGRGVSVLALNGLSFDLSTSNHRVLAQADVASDQPVRQALAVQVEHAPGLLVGWALSWLAPKHLPVGLGGGEA